MCKVLCLFVMLGVGSFMSSAWGQAQTSISEATGAAIPAEPLASALQSWAQLTGLQLMYDSELAVDQGSNGAPEGLSAIESLGQILDGTGLEYRFLNERTVLILPSTKAVSKARFYRAALQGRGQAAEQSAADDSSDNSAEKRTTSAAPLQEILVTAQKREERLRDVPISISVLGGSNLDKSSFTGLVDALQTVPGVATMPALGTTSGTLLNIRGVGAQNYIQSGSSPIGYYIDSVPFSLIRNPIAPDLNPYDLERVEILRGPQGTLYGANSTNGLVRVLTKDANLNDFELKTRLSTSSTTDEGGGNYRGDVAINMPLIEGKLAARAVMGYQRLSGWIDGPIGNNLNDGEVRNYRVKLSAQPSEALAVGLSAWTNRAHYGALNQATDDGLIGASLPQPSKDNFDAYSVKLSYDFSGFSVTSMSSYLHSLMAGVQDTYVFDAPNTAQDASFNANVLSQEVLLTSMPSNAWKWTLGVMYRDADEHFFVTWPGVLPLPLNWTDSSESSAIFGQLGKRFLNDKLEWALGLRYFQDDYKHQQNPGSLPENPELIHDERSYHATTPRAVLSWYPSDKATVYASYGQGFRSGLSQHSFVLATVGPEVPDAKPDKLSNYEVGAKIDLMDRRLSFDTAVYYIHWRDIQQALGFIVNTPTYQGAVVGMTNGTVASGLGIDLAITARPLEVLEVGLTASWNDLTHDEDVRVPPDNDAVYLKGDRLSFSPEYTFGTRLGYTFPLGGTSYKGRFSASANYISELGSPVEGPISPTILTSDSILQTRAQLSIESRDRWMAVLFVDNLNNEHGAASPSFVAPQTARVRPRTVGLQLDYSF